MEINEIKEIVGQIVRDFVAETGLIQSKNQKILLLSSRYPFDFFKLLARIKEEYPADEFTILMPGLTEIEQTSENCKIKYYDLNNNEAIKEIIDTYETYEAVFLLAPGLKLMESIAMMDDTEVIPDLLFNFLLSGKRVGILINWDYFKPNLNLLGKKFRENLNVLAELGIEIVKSKHDLEKVKKYKFNSNDLITEAKIVELEAEGLREILCNKGCIITSLAMDKAKELGLKIKFES